MIRWLLVALLMFTLLPAAAQDAEQAGDVPEEQTAAPAVEFVGYSSTQYGFSINVPATGTLKSPDDPDWTMDPEIGLVWEGGEDDPVTLVELRVDTIGDTVTSDQFDQFYSSLLEHWEKEPGKYTINRSNEPPYRFGSMDWSIIEVADKSHESGKSVFYTIFATYAGDSIYTIGFYYLKPVSKAVQDMAVPMMKSFSVSK